MATKRLRITQTKTFQERLAEEAAHYKELAGRTPSGMQQELYLRRARQAETAAHIEDWLRSPGLRAPTELENLKPQK